MCGLYIVLPVVLCVLLLLLPQVPGWKIGESTSATGRWIPPPAPFGIEDPVVA